MRSLLILLVMTNFLTAQKTVKKSFVNTSISAIQIDVSKCFELNIENSDTDVMIVSATIDGEYRKDLLLNVKEEGTTLFIGADFQPNFKNPNDKLSAHKVISIALDIKLPEGKNVNIYGTHCNVSIQGVYEKVKVTLNDGSTKLCNVSGRAEVSAQSGNIYVKTHKANIISNSKYGKVTGDEILSGNSTYICSTITGNIFLNRIE